MLKFYTGIKMLKISKKIILAVFAVVLTYGANAAETKNTYEKSNYKRSYKMNLCPKEMDTFISAIFDVVAQFVKDKNINLKDGRDYIGKLKSILGDNIEEAGAILLLSNEKVSQDHPYNFYNIINWAIENDKNVEPIIKVVLAINSPNYIRKNSAIILPQVLYHQSYLAKESIKTFFTTGKKYRVPQFFGAIEQCIDINSTALFAVKVDPQPGLNLINYIERPEGTRYIFCPYSVFTVTHISFDPSGKQIIHVSAEPNPLSKEFDNLPLAPIH
jgi:hypothetical protein